MGYAVLNLLRPMVAGDAHVFQRRRFIPGFLLLLGIHATALSYFGASSRGRLISIAVQTWCSVIATAFLWGASRRCHGPARAFWFFLGLSAGFWAFANAICVWADYSGTVFSPQSYLATAYRFYAIPIVMLLLVSDRMGAQLEWANLLDFLQVTILTILLYSGLFYVPARHMSARDVEILNLARFANTQNVLLLMAALLRYHFTHDQEYRRLLRRLILFLSAYSVVSAIGNTLTLLSRPRVVTAFDLIWSGFYVLIAVLAATWLPRTSADSGKDGCTTGNNFVAHNSILALLLVSTIAAAEYFGGTWHNISMCAVVLSVLLYAIRLSISELRQQRAVQALVESERQYRYLFAKSPQPMWVFDGETMRFLDVNEATLRAYGYTRQELLGMTVLGVRPPEDVPAFRKTVAHDLANEVRPQGVWRHKKKDGTIMEVEIAASRVAFDGRTAILSLIHDVTERRSLEQQLRQAQKMEAVGLLAGGIAHDFNNLLNVILGYLQLIPDATGDSQTLSHYTEKAVDATRRAAILVRQLLAFSRKQVLWPRILNLNQVIGELGKMLPRLLGERIEIVIEAEPELNSIKVDESQIEQVVLNVAVNARDAMPDGGTLTISTRNHVSQPTQPSSAEMPPGTYVCLSIRDTGVGMDSETLSRIFEPFFTTKAKGKGTGLGLAIVYGIVKQSGGFVGVSSNPGQGTSFDFFFPQVAEAAKRMEHPTSDATSAAPKLHGTVLVVEDEDALREATLDYLKHKGCQVLGAHDGSDAINVLKASSQPVQVLVTDVVMPKMGGEELARRVRLLYPDVHIIFVSGYNDEMVARCGAADTACAFLPKPYTFRDLCAKIREAAAHSHKAMSGPAD